MNDARRIADTAAAWIARRDAGLDAAGHAELAAWRAGDPRHAAALDEHEALWSGLDRPRAAGAGPALHRELDALAHRQRRRRALGASAALAAGVAVVFFAWRPAPPAPVTDATAMAATTAVLLVPERRVLPDGSVVEHPAGAEVAIDFSGPQRRAELRRGTAHFTVAKNPARPFVVVAGGVEVRAVGTAFAVEVGAQGVEVLVTEGRVAVAAPAADADADAALVDAGQHLAVAPRAQAVALPPAAISARLAWRSPRLEFSATPLAEVVALLNRHHRARFVLDDPALSAVPLSGVFRADETEAFVRMLEQGFRIEVRREPDGTLRLRRR